MPDSSPFDSSSWGRPAPQGPTPSTPAPPKRPTGQRLLEAARGRGTGGPRLVVWLISAVVAIALGLGAGIALKEFAVQPFRVPSASMHPTLQEGDQIVVEKLSYLLGGPRRGQVVVFDGAGTYDPKGAPQTFYVKRVIAVAGDTIECCDEKRRLLVNGSPVAESYVAEEGATSTFRKVTVPEGEIFVMGDNRRDSLDSRMLGTVPVDKVVGHVFARTWPMKRIHTVPVE